MLGPRPTLADLAAERFDLIVVGGGISGAGILLEAARRGVKTLLVEQADFASGASSRSSKMVHGGLRYIPQGRLGLTRDALLERERLVAELPDLVIRQPYAYVVRRGVFPGRWPLELVLGLYDAMAGIRDHHWLGRDATLARIPGLAPEGLVGAMVYTDALTDDARLVLRILHEAAAEGGRMINHVRVTATRQGADEFAVEVHDTFAGTTATLSAARVIRAGGPWVGEVAGEAKKIRPLRGSHLFFTRDRLPLSDCVAAAHPRDRRPVYAFPWAGATCVGTTDLDHATPLSREPRATVEEMDYLLEFLAREFPERRLGRDDVIATQAGIRPVVPSGKGLNPSQESRDHSVWHHGGEVLVAGGKLTTFRLIALDALAAAGLIDAAERKRARRTKERLFRHAVAFPDRLGHPTAPLPEGEALIEAFAWTLDHEMVGRLDDLLARRLRLLPARPAALVPLLATIEPFCRDRLGWDATRWHAEVARLAEIAEDVYGLPTGDVRAIRGDGFRPSQPPPNSTGPEAVIPGRSEAEGKGIR